MNSQIAQPSRRSMLSPLYRGDKSVSCTCLVPSSILALAAKSLAKAKKVMQCCIELFHSTKTVFFKRIIEGTLALFTDALVRAYFTRFRFHLRSGNVKAKLFETCFQYKYDNFLVLGVIIEGWKFDFLPLVGTRHIDCAGHLEGLKLTGIKSSGNGKINVTSRFE